MKKERDYGMGMPMMPGMIPNQGMMNQGIMASPGMMPMMPGMGPGMGPFPSSITATNININEDEINRLEKRINMLERRVAVLEENNNPNTYSSSSYQML